MTKFLVDKKKKLQIGFSTIFITKHVSCLTMNFSGNMLVAQGKSEAKDMRVIVEEFLSKAHYKQLHMFNP